ncbi:MAG: hypothetical protein J0H59_13785 [Comamonadaceae bacterium]|nr:hypothetical protein [Comamonadaceae bacterium]
MNDRNEDWLESGIIARHIHLEEQLGDGDDGNSLSGWQCINPWHRAIEREIAGAREHFDSSKYLYADQFPKIEQDFKSFHKTVDNATPERIFFGSASTQILYLISAWMHNQGVREIFYLAPAYHSLLFSMKMLGIRARPINNRHPFEADFSLNLPDKKTIIFITDPIWYAGIKIRPHVASEIGKWQATTGSIIVIDGSFQYLEWEGCAKNDVSVFDPSSTLRIVCPTKQLMLHGYRASYVLTPERFYQEISTLNSMIFASLSFETMALLHSTLNLIQHHQFPKKLMALASHRHGYLRQKGCIQASWQPDCGYFCFEELGEMTKQKTRNQILMDGNYFGQSRYPNHHRINLLSPQIALLYGEVDINFCV